MIGKLQASPPLGTLPALERFTQLLASHRRFASVVAVVLALGVITASLISARSASAPAFATQTVLQQDLTQTVTASGTVNPQNTVTVGTQVSGTINALYVDYNSKVRKGQVLAKLDTSQLQAQLQQARAALAQAQAQAAAQNQTAAGAQAGIQVAQANSNAQRAAAQAAQAAIAGADANVEKSRSALQIAQQTVARDRTLLAQGYIAQSQYDTDASNAVAAQSALTAAQAAAAQSRAQAGSSLSQAEAGSAQADVNRSQAGASQDTAQAAQAAVAAAQAQLSQDQLTIDRAVITSPVDGTVIARSVSVGQTVAASLQTPTLFTIAQDLKKMEVDIAVGEPDIGNVRPGDTVDFTVLAYPNQTFHGRVQQVRENPTTVSNVVTYTVITFVDNPRNQLLPGMTANATINVRTAHNALVIPTQALSFHPASGGSHRHSASARTTSSTAAKTSAASPWGTTSGGTGASATAGSNAVVFTLQNGKPQPVRVHVDLVTGTQAAVTPVQGSLSAGDAVIVSNAASTSSSRGARSGGPVSSGGAGMGGLGRAIR